MTDFLWHKVSEKEKEDIKKQAKQIMDSFSKKLEKVSDKISEPVVERDECEREEGKGEKAEIDRKIMFENASLEKKRKQESDTVTAPDKDDNFIIAEKGDWK